MDLSGITPSTGDAADIRQQFFQKADTNGDGQISKDEFKAALSQRAHHKGRHATGGGPNLDDLFTKIDTNGDGSIDQTESDAFLQQVQSRRQQRDADFFKAADTDHDGKLSQAELSAAFQHHHQAVASYDQSGTSNPPSPGSAFSADA